MLRSSIGRYVDFMYLSHGYFFFAPNPGPGHLIECQLHPENTAANQNVFLRSIVKKYFYPDRVEQWPRLLYHRHFMLSEFHHTLFAPTELEDSTTIDARIMSQWREDRRTYESLQESIRNNLATKHPGYRIVLKRIQHDLPSPRLYFVDRWKLTDPRLYGELIEGPAQAPDATQPSKPIDSPEPRAVPIETEVTR